MVTGPAFRTGSHPAAPAPAAAAAAAWGWDADAEAEAPPRGLTAWAAAPVMSPAAGGGGGGGGRGGGVGWFRLARGWNGMQRSREGRERRRGKKARGICVDVCVSEAYGDVFKRIAVFVAGIREFVIALLRHWPLGYFSSNSCDDDYYTPIFI